MIWLVLLEQAKASEFAQKQEMKMREELEALLTATKKQHEDLAENKEKATEGLDSSMRKLAILDARAKSIAFRMNEAVAELKLIQSSIGTLNQEIPKREKLELVHTDQVERCAYNHIMLPNCSSTVCADDLYNFRELTLSDIKAATCKFSDSLKVQPRGLGCVYKGEIMNRSVMIYKLHSCIIQSSMQFQQEVLSVTLFIMLVDILVIHSSMKLLKVILQLHISLETLWGLLNYVGFVFFLLFI